MNPTEYEAVKKSLNDHIVQSAPSVTDRIMNEIGDLRGYSSEAVITLYSDLITDIVMLFRGSLLE